VQFLEKGIGTHALCTAKLLPDGNLLPNPALVSIGQPAVTYNVPFEPLHWDRLPQMNSEEYRAMRQHVFARYGARSTPKPERDFSLDDATPVLR
jgi:hypothetical protein